jgi:hypothetical protein
MQKITIQNPFSSIVYVHWRYDICLYVGRSGFGLTRPFEKSHKMWNHKNEITHTDIYQVSSIEESRTVEKRMTRDLKPKYDESFLAGWSRIGKEKHSRRLLTIPPWVLDNEKIKELIKTRFPKAATDLKQRKSAARMIRLIHLYYEVGATMNVVAQELHMTANAVDLMLRRLNKQMSGPLKPSHRPKKINAVGIRTANEGSPLS